MRRIVAHAFSDKALLAHEPLVHDYVDQLVSRVKESCADKDAETDMVRWYKW